MISVLAVLVIGAEFVRGLRESSFQWYGITTKFEKYPYVPASLYLYFSAHPGTFNAYLKADEEHPFPGTYTFAPVMRVLVRLGLADPVPLYQRFYNIPIPVNTGTYLRDIHAEFGAAGILIVPYLLGLICTMLWVRLKQKAGLMTTVWLSHLYVVVALTFLTQGTQVGFWFLSLLVSLLTVGMINRRGKSLMMPAHSNAIVSSGLTQ
jgi:oligosaccharide repeat unit polymerase